MYDQQAVRTAGNETARNLDILPGLSHQRVFGFGDISSGASYVTVWPPATAYPWPTAAVSLEIVSTSLNDAVAGTHARVVTFEVLDENWIRHTITVTLNGTTPVPVAIPSAGNQAWRVERAQVVATGVRYNSNAGDIEIRVAGGGTALECIKAGSGRSRRAAFSSGAEEEVRVPSALMYISGQRRADVRLVFNVGNNLTGVPGFATRVIAIDLLNLDGFVPLGNEKTWMKLPPYTDVEIMARPAGGQAGDTQVQLTSTGIAADVSP